MICTGARSVPRMRRRSNYIGRLAKLRKRGEVEIIARSLSFPVRAPCVGSDYIVGGGCTFAGYCGKMDRRRRLLTQTIRNALFVIETVRTGVVAAAWLLGWDAGVVLREVCWD